MFAPSTVGSAFIDALQGTTCDQTMEYSDCAKHERGHQNRSNDRFESRLRLVRLKPKVSNAHYR